MHRFETLDDVQSTLQRLIQRDPPIVKMLARQPGTKEARYAHLLSGDVPEASVMAVASTSGTRDGGNDDAFARLESVVEELKKEVAELKAQVESLRKAFE